MLTVTDLRVSYGDVVAVRDIDLDVADGETLALLGRSGSGKTTVLRAVAGLVEPDHGRIELGGRPLAGTPPHQRRIGLVFQDFALFPHLDVAANVGYGLRMRNITDVDRRVADALELVGLGDLGSRRIDQLSGGQAQRVALARTLVTEPDLLLLDEPLGSLDPDLRTELADEVAALLHRTGIPSIVVTHDTTEAFALGDRVAVIVDGRIVVAGSPEAVWSNPRSPEAARLVGHRNLVATTVTDDTARLGPIGIPTDAPDGPATILVRPGSITTPGPIEGTVLASHFVGPQWLTTVDIGDGTVEVPVAAPQETGARIGFDVDPSGTIVLPD